MASGRSREGRPVGQPYPSERQQRFVVRLPDGMRGRIADAAKENNRSMNAEIVSRLERSFAAPSEAAPASEAAAARARLAAERILRMTPEGDPHEVRLSQLERRVQTIEEILAKL